MAFDGENLQPQAAIRGAVAAAVAITVKTVWTIAHPYYKAGSRLRVVLMAASPCLVRYCSPTGPEKAPFEPL
jgi:chromate transporter